MSPICTWMISKSYYILSIAVHKKIKKNNYSYKFKQSRINKCQHAFIQVIPYTIIFEFSRIIKFISDFKIQPSPPMLAFFFYPRGLFNLNLNYLKMVPHKLKFVKPECFFRKIFSWFFPMYSCKNLIPPFLPHSTLEDHNSNKRELIHSIWECFHSSFILSGQLVVEKKTEKDYSLYIPIQFFFDYMIFEKNFKRLFSVYSDMNILYPYNSKSSPLLKGKWPFLNQL